MLPGIAIVHSLLWLSNIPLHTYTTLKPAVCDEHLGWFHILAIINSTTMNIGEHVSFWIRVFIFPEYIPGSAIAGSYGSSSQSYGFSSSHVWMWQLTHKEDWEPKNWCFWTVVFVKTLESLLDCKETKPVNPKGNPSWIFIGGTDAEAETPILWPPDAKSQLIWKDLECHPTLVLLPGKSHGWRSLVGFGPWGC